MWRLPQISTNTPQNDMWRPPYLMNKEKKNGLGPLHEMLLATPILPSASP
jgi:hypothetical protein